MSTTSLTQDEQERTYHPRAGDIVRIGKGTKLWTVSNRFWTDRPGSQIATTNDPRARAVGLDPISGYTTSSAMVARLTLVKRPSTPDRRPGS